MRGNGILRGWARGSCQRVLHVNDQAKESRDAGRIDSGTLSVARKPAYLFNERGAGYRMARQGEP